MGGCPFNLLPQYFVKLYDVNDCAMCLYLKCASHKTIAVTNDETWILKDFFAQTSIIYNDYAENRFSGNVSIDFRSLIFSRFIVKLLVLQFTSEKESKLLLLEKQTDQIGSCDDAVLPHA